MRPLVIIGAGGLGAEVAALVEAINRVDSAWQLLGFADDDADLHGSRILGYDVLGGIDIVADRNDVHFVVAIGNSHVRSKIVDRMSATSCRPATLVHPEASIHESSGVGEGSIICRGATITVRVSVGAHVIVNLHSTIGHDCVLGTYTTLHPAVNMSGCSTTGDRVELGTGAVLLPGIGVGANSTIGAGAVVTKDVGPGSVAIGVPARVIRTREPIGVA